MIPVALEEWPDRITFITLSYNSFLFLVYLFYFTNKSLMHKLLFIVIKEDESIQKVISWTEVKIWCNFYTTLVQNKITQNQVSYSVCSKYFDISLTVSMDILINSEVAIMREMININNKSSYKVYHNIELWYLEGYNIAYE